MLSRVVEKAFATTLAIDVDSQSYSALILRSLTEKTFDQRRRLIRDVRDYAKANRAVFFKVQAENLLSQLVCTKTKKARGNAR